jgi:hypothetical protein
MGRPRFAVMRTAAAWSSVGSLEGVSFTTPAIGVIDVIPSANTALSARAVPPVPPPPRMNTSIAWVLASTVDTVASAATVVPAAAPLSVAPAIPTDPEILAVPAIMFTRNAWFTSSVIDVPTPSRWVTCRQPYWLIARIAARPLVTARATFVNRPEIGVVAVAPVVNVPLSVMLVPPDPPKLDTWLPPESTIATDSARSPPAAFDVISASGPSGGPVSNCTPGVITFAPPYGCPAATRLPAINCAPARPVDGLTRKLPIGSLSP